ncbi:MAG: Flp pilus assembly protein CpaB [Rhodospirillales bacterium]|nr:MAG: Flp pilus assembly protein CpaB [Rhodospirillales bacterium]
MNARNIIVLVIGLAMAGGTGFMMWKFLNAKQNEIKAQVQNERQKVPPTIPTVRVLVAKSDLVVGTQIGRENLHWQTWPQESVAPTYVVEGNKLTDAGKSEEKRLTIEDFIGAVVRLPIAAGQPLTPGLVARAGDRGFLAAVLQPGMRAMSIGVSQVSGISGFILPGDRVDILWDVKSSSKGFPFTQTLMRDIRVIAIDQKTQASGATPAKTITLELTPVQVEALSLASSMGSLEFVLRSIAPDKDEQKRMASTEDGLLQVSMSDGTQAGALIGSDLLAVSQDDEKEEISRDSWTVERDLLFGGKKPRQLVLPQPTRPRTGSGGSGKKKTVATSGGSSRSRIVIVRGTKSQSVNVK